MEQKTKKYPRLFERCVFFGSIAFELGFFIYSELSVNSTFSPRLLLVISWSIRVIYFIFLGWYCVGRLHMVRARAAKAGLFRGGIIGLIIGVFTMVWYHNVNAFVQLLALPWQTLAVGYVVTGAAAYVTSIWQDERTHYLHTH